MLYQREGSDGEIQADFIEALQQDLNEPASLLPGQFQGLLLELLVTHSLQLRTRAERASPRW